MGRAGGDKDPDTTQHPRPPFRPQCVLRRRNDVDRLRYPAKPGLAGRMVNTMIRREAPLHGLVVADVQAAYQAPFGGKMAPDHFHPNAAGYEDWATAFVRALDW